MKYLEGYRAFHYIGKREAEAAPEAAAEPEADASAFYFGGYGTYSIMTSLISNILKKN